ncbi:uncharacterized protein MELLADRAFT_116051 [Melampsora larici-populina 98AG31]|uniref:Tetratricopeptide SHNi-TPR domain-containing protein n=1 Tax=Melampsora larici-populina (strain 98AG31 / pathotype 3-4-7) TaxID=747676 RepID=F4RHJ2_MELLP|nr:uncharacterized protein MELLADRAFT_116051 [Melampsora larici-populina 98AG31]EGG08349.1 hypothetical protein MELLADRAFT_116051 [Melampsora larici-populina 98AG31]
MDSKPAENHQLTNTESKKSTNQIKPPNEKILKSIQSDLAEGSKSFALKNYQDATDSFSRACETLSIHYGDQHPAVVDAQILYGKALVKHAIKLNACLGGGGGEPNKDEPEPESNQKVQDSNRSGPSGSSDLKSKKASGSKPTNTNPHIHFSGDSSDEDEDQDQEEKAGSDEDDLEQCTVEEELEAAFYVLELARSSIEIQLSDESLKASNHDEFIKLKKKLIQVFELLAEVHQEGDKFDEALNSYLSSLKVKESLPTEVCSRRSMAETHLWTALAYELLPERSDSISKSVEHVENAIELMKTYIEKLKTVPQAAPLDAKEIALQAYLKDVVLPHKNENGTSVVNDLSMLVKRKKNPVQETEVKKDETDGLVGKEMGKRSLEEDVETGMNKKSKVDES